MTHRPHRTLGRPEVQICRTQKGGPAIAGGHVVVGTFSADRKQGLLLVLDMKNGSKLFEYVLPEAVAAEGVAIAAGRVYVSTWSGIVLCLAPAN